MSSLELHLPLIADEEDKDSALKNRLRNTYRHLRKWAKRTQTNAFRIYDREIREYPLAIDFYAGRFCVHYFAPSKEDEEAPQELHDEVALALSSLFGAKPKDIFWRTRIKREKVQQYEKQLASKAFFSIFEYGVQFYVNLLDYLDTGLFLDHRETRQLVAAASKGKRLLNLFSYTAAFSVHAAVAGSTFTKSVDMSNTYTGWAKNNFLLNKLPLKNHQLVRADCLKFLQEELLTRTQYDVIVIDPPTISRSKKMEGLFDLQNAYIDLISNALLLLKKDGVIFFSTNSRKFVFDPSHFPLCRVIDISKKTIPLDFHDPKTHRCWKIFYTPTSYPSPSVR